MKKMLVLCGASGSGKSYLEDKLCSLYPQDFVSLLQYTTRPRRKGDDLDTYLFLNSNTDVELMKRGGLKIIGETEILGNLYGTFLNESIGEDIIQTVVLNRTGIDNLYKNPVVKDYSIKVVKILTCPDVEILKRLGRSDDYYKQEIESLEGVEDLTLIRTSKGFNYQKIRKQILDLFKD